MPPCGVRADDCVMSTTPSAAAAPASAAEPRAAARRLELAATVLLALATDATARSAYQARVWPGDQSQAYSRATAARIAVNRASAVANRQVQIDVSTFIEWVDARASGRTRLADFYETRFRDEFRPAFEAWLATKPLENPDAPKTPFAMPRYRLAANVEADRLEAKAAAGSDVAAAANQRAENYTLAVVLFASSLFFAGISTKLDGRGPRTATFGIGVVVFLGTLVWLVTLPAQVNV
jgi:hypothetical protein